MSLILLDIVCLFEHDEARQIVSLVMEEEFRKNQIDSILNCIASQFPHSQIPSNSISLFLKDKGIASINCVVDGVEKINLEF